MQQALDRNWQCMFSGVIPNNDSHAFVPTLIFPFLGFVGTHYSMPSNLHWYFPRFLISGVKLLLDRDLDACELMVVTDVVSGRKDVIALFWENKLGVGVDVCVSSPHLIFCPFWYTSLLIGSLLHHHFRGIRMLRRQCTVERSPHPCEWTLPTQWSFSPFTFPAVPCCQCML